MGSKVHIFKSAAAAVAITAAAVMTPGVAQADDDIVAPGAGIAGNSALGYLLDDSDAPHEPIFNGEGDFLPNFFENDFWWFGPANPEAPPQTTVFVIDVYSVLPTPLKPLWGWFLNGEIDWEACAFGASVRLGPYGSVTGSLASHC